MFLAKKNIEVIFKVITSVYIIKYVKRRPIWSGGTSQEGALLRHQLFLVKANVGVVPIRIVIWKDLVTTETRLNAG